MAVRIALLPRSVTAILAVPGTKVEELGRGAAGVTTDARPPPLTFGQKKELIIGPFLALFGVQ